MADAYVKLQGIDGESTDAKHKNWIEVLNFNLSASNPVTVGSGVGGLSAGRVQIPGFSFTKRVDKATPAIFNKCCSGDPIPKVEVEICKHSGDKHCYLKYIFTNAMISSTSPSGFGGEEIATEGVSIAFGKIEIEYTPTGHDGKPGTKVPTSWDLTKNDK